MPVLQWTLRPDYILQADLELRFTESKCESCMFALLTPSYSGILAS